MKTIICKAERCGKKSAPGKGYCYRCAQRRWRAKNPEKAAYNNLKSNAKRRGKFFDLTFDQFKEFCQSTEYIKRKGRKANCIHVDRIDENKGYTEDNIQALTNSQNIRKYVRYTHQYDEREKKMIFETSVVIAIEEPTKCPF